MAFIYLKVKSAKCLFNSDGLGLGLVISGLGLIYFGLGLKNLDLFTSLLETKKV